MTEAEKELVENLTKEFATGPLACDGTHTMFWNVLTKNEKELLVEFIRSYANLIHDVRAEAQRASLDAAEKLAQSAELFAARVQERNPEWFRELRGSTDFSDADWWLREALAAYRKEHPKP